MVNETTPVERVVHQRMIEFLTMVSRARSVVADDREGVTVT
jgi:hypothetical protein